MKPCKIWIEQCDAARGIKDDFGTDKALTYVIGEKFLDFLEAAETIADFGGSVNSQLQQEARIIRRGFDS